MAGLRLNKYRNNEIPTVSVPFKPGWQAQKIKHRVLSISQLSKAWVQTIRAIVKTMISGSAAEEYCRKEAYDLALKGLQSDWKYVKVDTLGNIGILNYRGIQVALFFKRQVTEIAPIVGEKPPENPITDPDEVWQRLDILGPSAKKANIVLKNYHDKLEEDNVLLTRQLKLEKQRSSNFEDQVLRYKVAEDYKKEILKKRAQADRDKFKPKRKRTKTDRLCTLCGCYENVHNFNRRGKCLGCDGGKPNCESCTFRPKKVRVKKTK